MSSAYEFQFTGGELCLDFANTVNLRPTPQKIDRIDSFEALLGWAAQAGILPASGRRELARAYGSEPAAARRTLQRAIELRECIFRLMARVADRVPVSRADLDVLNTFLAAGIHHTRLEWVAGEPHAGWKTELPPDSADRILWPIARSAAELLVSENVARVRRCRGEDCDWLFIDTSKNQTREWCKMSTCGNRAKVRRYRERASLRG